jgi:hypothetical protein
VDNDPGESVGIARGILTGPDNRTHEAVNWIAIFGALAGILIAVGAFLMGKTFDFQGFGIGLGAVVGATGAAQKMRDG